MTWRVPLLAVAWLFLLVLSAHAVQPGERLANPALEARARAISAELRCLVCQNESIDESNADLAHDIRVLVRQRLTAGDTDAQAIQAVVNRYGAFVLLRPPVEPATYLLWFAPPALVLIGLSGTVLWLRRRRSHVAAPAPLECRGDSGVWMDCSGSQTVDPALSARRPRLRHTAGDPGARCCVAAVRVRIAPATTRRSIATSFGSWIATSPGAC